MEKINEIYKLQLKQKPAKNSWWFPLWKGLIVDENAKHRIRMGTSIWLYLYLLFSVNRKTGITYKKQKDMAIELGFSIRTIQKHLLRLSSNNYIIIEKQSKPQKIQITKWKLFNHKKFDD